MGALRVGSDGVADKTCETGFERVSSKSVISARSQYETLVVVLTAIRLVFDILNTLLRRRNEEEVTKLAWALLRSERYWSEGETSPYNS